MTIDIYLACPEEITDSALLALYENLLSADEVARMKRFRFPQHRQQHLVTRALARAVLSQYADVPPECWVFTQNEYGRPEVAGPVVPEVKFNLTHTDGLVACAVGKAEQIGIDAENLDRRLAQGELLELAERYFAPSECAALRKLPAEKRRERFFAYWTLKESYIKARGRGISLPLGKFAFDLDSGDSIGISIEPELDDTPAGWHFSRWQEGEAHRLALAVHHPGGEMKIDKRWFTPLIS